ncbi:MAG: hypothetical protein AAF485_09535 [Chloroflexota bacterium]
MSPDTYNASLLYDRGQCRRFWREVWALLTGSRNRLLSLDDIEISKPLGGRYAAGVQDVPITQIQGSENRACNFDSNFYPLQSESESRWISIATAWEQGKILPRVELIQVGDVYFVRDGHHRISVARAFGVREIEADVTVWAA